MAKITEYKLDWVKCTVGLKWDVPTGWEVVTVILPLQEQDGKILVLLRGSEK